MTTLADPYPPDLASLDFAPASLDPISEVPLIREVARIATALEQIALALMDHPQSVQDAPGAALVSLPPVQTAAPQTNGVCPIHNVPWKTVPGGISKRTGQPYSAFQACSVSGCDQRPPR